jgi:hypothetical protein
MTEYSQEEREKARYQLRRWFDVSDDIAFSEVCALNRKTADLDEAMRLLREARPPLTRQTTARKYAEWLKSWT